jgi:hypothetical protein
MIEVFPDASTKKLVDTHAGDYWADAKYKTAYYDLSYNLKYRAYFAKKHRKINQG